MKRIEIDVNYLRATAHYDPNTGLFTSDQWRIYAPTKEGYCAMRDPASGITLMQHRAAYAYMCGMWPPIVDHINRDRSDNRWRNLRASNTRANARNHETSAQPIRRIAQKRSARKPAPPPAPQAPPETLPPPCFGVHPVTFYGGQVGIQRDGLFYPLSRDAAEPIKERLLTLWAKRRLTLKEDPAQ